MTACRLFVIVVAGALLMAADAAAQVSLTPPGLEPPATTKAAPNPKAKAPGFVKKPPATEAKPAPPAPSAAAATAPAPVDSNADLVYGAYQRGLYKTAFDLANAKAQVGDVKAMTMLGELYSNALGVKRDYARAIDWYKRASDGGDREAMFALAMMRLSGRGGPVDREAAVKLLASSAKLGEPKAAYNLALLYLDGQTLPQDLKRSAELLTIA
ncbi:MAG: sel1 repeat family protein, partial [Bradyrhizobium sp.]|nr:sel1 repeat family protein [Bradyrhizobium sp.]